VIIVLPVELFEGNDTPDAELNHIFIAGRKRYKIRLKPSYRPGEIRPFEAWLEQQSVKMRGVIRAALERGLTEWEFQVPEPSIRVERRDSPVWPDSLATGPVKLPIDMIEAFVGHRLDLILENARNDWGFLNKLVPPDWQRQWKQAIDEHWIAAQGAGITEIPKLIREQISCDPVRRLRTWVMFDRDSRTSNHFSADATKAQTECTQWGIPHHVLERRAIENYIPERALFDWAKRQSRSNDRDKKVACVKAYRAMTAEQRHHYNVAEGFQKDAKSHKQLDDETRKAVELLYGMVLTNSNGPLYTGLGGNPAQDIWGNDPDKNPYDIPEEDLESEKFGNERAKIFQSIFAML